MNGLFKAVWERFSATTGSGFYNDISGRLYHNIAPQQATFPYCVYFSISDLDDLDFSDEYEDFIIQFNIFSQNNSALEAGELLESLKDMFDNCDMTVTGWNHLQFQRSAIYPNNEFNRVPPVQGYSVEYDVLLQKQRS